MISRRQNMEMGVVLTLVLLVVGLISGEIFWYKIAVSALLVTALIPVVYTPLSRLWFGFARLAERFFSIIILTLIFYLIVTPIALLRRCFFEDTLRLRNFGKGGSSVFIIKDKTYQAEDLEKQY